MKIPFDSEFRRNRVRASLQTKLNAPSARPQQVSRQKTIDLMCATQTAKLVLLRAPAGFGKTTVMLQYRRRLENRGVATSWLTVDSADNDAPRFLTGLEATVATMAGDTIVPSSGDKRMVGDVALDVIASLAAHDEPFALFLDDFEVIYEPGVLGLVREIIDNLPRSGQLVIGSRSLPDLRLGRLRAHGQLLEVDASRLRFTLKETTGFFAARRNIPLSRDDVSRLHRKTEGWAAALWLASAALERSDAPAEFIERFSGIDQSVTDYLAEEVLSRQPAHIRDFLLRTSVLKHLEASLCNAVLPNMDSQRILHELEAADVLLVPLGDVRRSYRYHSLFASFLKAQLEREAPQAVPALHAAAAGWYEAQGRPVPTIDHTVEAGDTTRAIALLNAHAVDLLAQGRIRLLSHWFAALPLRALAEHPQLQLVHMWAVCFTRGPWEAMNMLEHSGLESSTLDNIAPLVRALKPSLLVLMDRYEDAYAVGLQSLKHLPSAVPFADNVLANAMATITSVIGDRQHARQLIDSARRCQGTSASAFNQMYSDATEGIIDLQEARLRQATARFRMAVTATHAGGHSYTNGYAWAGVPYAAVVYEAGDLDQAARLLQVYLPLACDVGLADHIILGYTMVSRIAFCRGDVDQALQLLIELEYVGHKGRLLRVVSGAKLERARVQLLQGLHHASREELDRADEPGLWHRVESLRFLANDLDYMALARMRWELHAGDARAAADQLAAAAEAATVASRHRRALKLRLLQAMAMRRGADAPAALTLLTSVLETTCAEGFVRLVLDEGELAGAMLQELARSLCNNAHRKDPIFADYVQHLSKAFGPILPAAEATASSEPAVLLEPLTHKEIRVLQLLAEGYSNNAMAEKLFVSDSTVRTHLRNINSKLDARSRMQAVAVARRLGVIR